MNKSVKIYAVLTAFLIVILLVNGFVSAVAYLNDIELELDDINAVISLVSFMCVILCMSQLCSWMCCTNLAPFKLIAIGNLAVDVLILIVFCYLNGSFLTNFDEEEPPYSVIITALSIFCVLVLLVRIFIMFYGLYRDIQSNKVDPGLEMKMIEKDKLPPIYEDAKINETLNESTSIVENNNIKVPAKWTNLKRRKEYFLADVDSHTDEYKTVVEDFLDRMRPNAVKIIKLQRVENIEVYRRYKAYKDEICRENSNMRKKLLFFATKNEDFIDQICQYGFIDATTSVLHTEKNGICFSYFPKLFHDRLSLGATTSEVRTKQMFRVKVVAESEGIEDDTKIIDSTKNEQFTDYSQGSIYICTHEAQSYPEYLITYK